MAGEAPMQIPCPFCATMIPAGATVCGYCERPTGLVVASGPTRGSAGDTARPVLAGRPQRRISLRLIVGILFGLCCLVLVLYGVYVMGQT